MRMYDIIEKKKNGGELTPEEIEFAVSGYTNGIIPDYQMSAFLMAVYFKGMTDTETYNLTLAMRDSGDKIDLSSFNKTFADKHSTGGVGDKTSLIVCPIAASLSCCTAKMSGRGLGHTGGTVDKLESIKGYRTELSPGEFEKQVNDIGIAIVGQSGNLAPADKKIYALRDVTATVDSIPLIASSIMSKKLAAGADVIVLDVKTGSGAFMKTQEDAEKLACEMIKIGKSNGKKVAALITDMNEPLGFNIGNALEVSEAVEVLKGNEKGELLDICLALSAQIVSLCKSIEFSQALKLCEDSLRSGKALGKFKEWISRQGAEDLSFIENPGFLCPSKYTFEFKSENVGYAQFTNAEEIGKAALALKAGREKKEDNIDFSAGIILKKKTGDKVQKGETIAVFKCSEEKLFSPALEAFKKGMCIASEKPKKPELIKNRLV